MGADSGHGQADGRRWVFASRVRAVPIIVHEPARSHRGPAGYERRVSGAIPAASGPAGIAAGSGTVEKRPRENTTASQSCRGRPQGWPEPLQTTASMPPGPASGRGGARRSRRCAPCRAAPTPARSALAVADVEARASFDEEFHDRERPLGRARFVEVRGGGERALRIGRVVETECRGIGGRSAVTSTSRPSRSRMALAYSARFRRWSAGRPGSGRAAAAASTVSSREAASASSTARSGRRAPCGASRRAAACDDPFPGVGMLRGRCRIERLKAQPAGSRPIVMTADA